VGAAPAGRVRRHGHRFLKHAYMNEIMALSAFASSLFGCQAPKLRQPDDPW